MGEAYLANSKGALRDERQRAQYYKDWRTYQMSDHLVMWVQLRTDFGEDYLRSRSGA